MSRIVFVDVETTGLDPARHEVWEIAFIVRDHEHRDIEFTWQLPVDLGLADPAALRVGRFHDRRTQDLATPTHIAHLLAERTRDAYLAAAVPSFDAAFLAAFLRRHGQCPMWRHRLICVESMAMTALGFVTPPGLRDSAEHLDIEFDESDLHTALGDARLARDVYDASLNRRSS